MEEQPAAQYVTPEHTLLMADGDLVSDVMVIALIIDKDGDQGVIISSASMSHITKLGLLECAQQVTRQSWPRKED